MRAARGMIWALLTATGRRCSLPTTTGRWSRPRGVWKRRPSGGWTPGTARRRRGGCVRKSWMLPASNRSPAVRSRARRNRECPPGLALRCGRTSRPSHDGGPRRAGGGLMSPAAEELRFLATAVSAVCGRPGFVPDEYLDELDGAELGHPGADPTVLAAE